MAVEGHSTEKAKPDLSVTMPEAVTRAAARSQELSDQLAARRVSQENPTPEVKPENNSDLPLFKNNQPPVQPTPVKMPDAPQAPPPDPEHQLRSLQGRYSKAEEDNRRMAAQIADMQRLFASLQSAPPAPQQVVTSDPNGSGVRFSGPITGRRYVQPKEEQEYGTELIDVMGRRAMEVVEPAIGQLAAELAGIKRQLGGVQRSVVYDAQEKMYGQLAKEVPNWGAVNEHPEYHRWLSMPDPASGRVRQELLSEAYGRNEASRVAHFFKSFLTENGYAAPSSDAVARAPNPQSNGVDLAQFAAPGRAKPGQTAAVPDKPIIMAEEIKQFYADSAQGKYKGREADYNAIQKQIMDAMNDGRIRR
jgi:hypothetical protein